MNAAPTDHPVTVTLSDCTDDDARRVLSFLAAEFSDRSPTQDTPGSDSTNTTVWTAELDVAGGEGSASSASRADGIGGSVSLTAQGAPHDVATVRKALEAAFAVEDAGSVSGDQEIECQFRLVPR
ncbi:hypothetical protein OKJ48_27360 [Streptomyces kunmingensis]|uniref:Uncharacterized protein n=1 Tax=Streptomyces kunmingensis TaxID=68225 RepID=A0ABU6CGS8_9ACTN|nr:hypothetical protein [Streptomyces kunmingensis]MEB3963928.1 hypothetical protein [Streptomyces kunmingensis]